MTRSEVVRNALFAKYKYQIIRYLKNTKSVLRTKSLLAKTAPAVWALFPSGSNRRPL
jgi:hypothetical protein